MGELRFDIGPLHGSVLSSGEEERKYPDGTVHLIINETIDTQGWPTRGGGQDGCLVRGCAVTVFLS